MVVVPPKRTGNIAANLFRTCFYSLQCLIAVFQMAGRNPTNINTFNNV